MSSARPGIVPPDARAIQLGQDAFERVLGVRPALVRSGGTLPIVAALADERIPTIISGFSLPDANIHAPNENIPARYIPLGHRDRQGAVRGIRQCSAARWPRATRPSRRHHDRAADPRPGPANAAKAGEVLGAYALAASVTPCWWCRRLPTSRYYERELAAPG